MTHAGTIHIAAAIVTRPDGALLLVRKRGTKAFMQPGGKIDGDEQPIEAVCRELGEELRLSVAPPQLTYIGRFSAPAANEADHRVVAEIFHLKADFAADPHAEIEEVRWVTPMEARLLHLAPLTRNHLLPLVEKF